MDKIIGLVMMMPYTVILIAEICGFDYKNLFRILGVLAGAYLFVRGFNLLFK